MKRFDLYILKSFIQPFFATFFVVVFVLVMQALWLAFDEIAGKGIDLFFILKFLWYLALIVTPTALPVGILLSAIIALGNLAENYEFAAIKSAGVSLSRVIRPLIVLTLFLSSINFVFLNNVYPWATLKQKNLYLNMKKKKPALALVPGIFNTEIPGYVIKFDEKYGAEENLLKNVQIADLSAGKGKAKVITAEKGIISSDEGSKYMEISLENGFYFEEHILKNASAKERKRVPASKARFKKYTLNIDISSFNDDKDLDNERVKEHHGMLSIQQLSDISKEKKVAFDQDVSNRATTFFQTLEVKQLHRYHDSVRIGLTPVILDNFVPKNKRLVIDQALQLLKRLDTNNKNNRKVFKSKRKLLNLYDFEYHYRISFSLACLVLFFIGAPLGAIIRKGGFGLPMVLAIFVFVTYFFIMQLGKNLAEESAISAIMGSWLATFIMLPIAFLLTRRATRGMSIVNIDNALNKIRTAFGTFKK